MDQIRLKDENLYLLVRGCAREIRFKLLYPKDQPPNMGEVVASISENDIVTSFNDALDALGLEANKMEANESIYNLCLQEFPVLRKVLMLSRRETTLREDGHHLITRIQRPVAKLLLGLAVEISASVP